MTNPIFPHKTQNPHSRINYRKSSLSAHVNQQSHLVMSFTRLWFTNRACDLMNIRNASNTTWSRAFKAHFGVSIQVLLHIWQALNEAGPAAFEREHLLWAMFFLKVYASEATSCSLFGVTPKTWRKWVCVVVTSISELECVG